MTSNAPDNALDVWLKFTDDGEEAEYEANTFHTEHGYLVEWYHNAIGLVSSSPFFKNYAEACQWLEAEGFQDCTVND